MLVSGRVSLTPWESLPPLKLPPSSSSISPSISWQACQNATRYTCQPEAYGMYLCIYVGLRTFINTEVLFCSFRKEMTSDLIRTFLRILYINILCYCVIVCMYTKAVVIFMGDVILAASITQKNTPHMSLFRRMLQTHTSHQLNSMRGRRRPNLLFQHNGWAVPQMEVLTCNLGCPPSQ